MTRRVVGLVAVAVAVGLAVLIAAAAADPLLLPVRATFGVGAGQPVQLGAVAVRIAALIPLALAGLALLLVPGAVGWTARLVADVAAAPIAVFLVAQLNGLIDLPALVLVYAATAAAVLLRVGSARWPYAVAGMLGIVPWGVVALEQVGGLLTGTGPAPWIRVLTLVVLALTIVEYLRRRGRSAPFATVLPPLALAVGVVWA